MPTRVKTPARRTQYAIDSIVHFPASDRDSLYIASRLRPDVALLQPRCSVPHGIQLRDREKHRLCTRPAQQPTNNGLRATAKI